MHYIIGTTIVVSGVTRPTNTQSINLSDQRKRKPRKAQNDTPFQVGVEYSLANIRKEDHERYLYRFYSPEVNDVVNLHFRSPSHADQYIATIKMEPLPDYDSHHRRRSN